METKTVLLTAEIKRLSTEGVVEWPDVGRVRTTLADVDHVLTGEAGQWGVRLERSSPDEPWEVRGTTDPSKVTQ